MVYAAEQALLLSYHENNVVESITNARPVSTENILPRILLSNYNQAVLTNRKMKLYEAPTDTWIPSTPGV